MNLLCPAHKLMSGLAASVLGCSILCCSMTARADDYIPPDLVKVTTPLYRPARVAYKPRPGIYEYSVGWEGITAASCSLTVREDGSRYFITAAARTYSGVDLLYKLRYEARGLLKSDDLSSISLSIDHRENSRHKTIEMRFEPDANKISAVRQTGDIAANQKYVEFSPNNQTLDPIGAAFLARSLDWNVSDVRHFDVFNGKSRYFITLTAVDRRNIRFQGRERPTIVISPQVRNLTTTKPRSKLRQAFIFVSDDEDRDILRIESSVFIGSVSVDLESYSPLPEQEDPIIMVKADGADEMRAQLRPALPENNLPAEAAKGAR